MSCSTRSSDKNIPSDGLFCTSRISKKPSKPLTPSKKTLRIYGSPQTPQYGISAFQYPRDEDIWSIPLDIDIVITHGPPRLHLGTRDFHRAGCPFLALEIAHIRPRLVVFGHIHVSYGREDVVLDGIRRRWEKITNQWAGWITLGFMAVVQHKRTDRLQKETKLRWRFPNELLAAAIAPPFAEIVAIVTELMAELIPGLVIESAGGVKLASLQYPAYNETAWPTSLVATAWHLLLTHLLPEDKKEQNELGGMNHASRAPSSSNIFSYATLRSPRSEHSWAFLSRTITVAFLDPG
ncbi:uncharacterized protein BDZ99DRAFT_482015 [Mytilinidion resinicola]|uniref:Calcineurin-like phosphoesterase domain-containing protein n=1 Tax=Mytilinidion resinicola TaxID=574789 RepID=A0A6A6Y507_9PEZI|nr:uncharacterized protein BDZ99DRAFT_482015 [Mytilinidion resinicola]KAF2803603.1 hypothetical protein BDZ99DRAFT_482015 [Mytilinidion resinicola]